MEAFKYCDLITTAFKHELKEHFPQLIFIDCAKKFANNHIVFASVAHISFYTYGCLHQKIKVDQEFFLKYLCK